VLSVKTGSTETEDVRVGRRRSIVEGGDQVNYLIKVGPLLREDSPAAIPSRCRLPVNHRLGLGILAQGAMGAYEPVRVSLNGLELGMARGGAPKTTSPALVDAFRELNMADRAQPT
jgi:hypothetical protein